MTKAKRATLRGMFGGKCAYCGCDLPEKGWHADHVKPIVRKSKWVNGKGFIPTGECYSPENDIEDNLFPACAPCNLEKRDLPLDAFRRSIERKIGTLRDFSGAFRHAERYGMVRVIKTEVVFYFEKFASSADGGVPDEPAPVSPVD